MSSLDPGNTVTHNCFSPESSWVHHFCIINDPIPHSPSPAEFWDEYTPERICRSHYSVILTWNTSLCILENALMEWKVNVYVLGKNRCILYWYFNFHQFWNDKPVLAEATGSECKAENKLKYLRIVFKLVLEGKKEEIGLYSNKDFV